MKAECENTEALKAIKERRFGIVPLGMGTLLEMLQCAGRGDAFRIMSPLSGPLEYLGVTYDYSYDCFMIKVSSPYLCPVEEGYCLPNLDPAVIESVEIKEEESGGQEKDNQS